jgi:hypothetical protein
MPASDPYYDVFIRLAQLDYDLLPDADILIVFKTPLVVWTEFLRRRGRLMDSEADFLEGYAAQDAFIASAEAYSAESGAHLIVREQSVSSPQESAAELMPRVALALGLQNA